MQVESSRLAPEPVTSVYERRPDGVGGDLVLFVSEEGFNAEGAAPSVVMRASEEEQLSLLVNVEVILLIILILLLYSLSYVS